MNQLIYLNLFCTSTFPNKHITNVEAPNQTETYQNHDKIILSVPGNVFN